MASNRCVVYMGPGKVEVKDIGYPKLELPEQNRKCGHWTTNTSLHALALDRLTSEFT